MTGAAVERVGSDVVARFEPDGEIAWIVLDRPARLNAMTDAMRAQIAAALERVDAGPWRALVLRGEGRAFCSGADLVQITGDVDVQDPQAVRRFMNEGWQAVIARLRTLSVPTVAAVHGPAYGGGANLALAADLVVAAESAVFCESYVDRGLTPDLGGTVILPRLVGLARARRMLMLGEPVPAAAAVGMGLVAEVVPDAALVARAAELARALAAKDPAALAGIRRLVEQNLTAELPVALGRETDAITASIAGDAFADAIRPFDHTAT